MVTSPTFCKFNSFYTNRWKHMLKNGSHQFNMILLNVIKVMEDHYDEERFTESIYNIGENKHKWKRYIKQSHLMEE